MSHNLAPITGTSVLVASPNDWTNNTIQYWIQTNSQALVLDGPSCLGSHPR